MLQTATPLGLSSYFSKKKCGQWRYCVDYKRLNRVTVKVCDPLPCVDETLDVLAGPVPVTVHANGNVKLTSHIPNNDGAHTQGFAMKHLYAVPGQYTQYNSTFKDHLCSLEEVFQE